MPAPATLTTRAAIFREVGVPIDDAVAEATTAVGGRAVLLPNGDGA
jgi:hypothetical protein